MQANPFKGKIIKDYTLGKTMIELQQSTLVEATRSDHSHVSFYVLGKKNLDQNVLVVYVNSLSENLLHLYPKLHEVLQSENYVYLVLQKLLLPSGPLDPQKLMQSVKHIYSNAGNKINPEEIFLKANHQLCYLPSFYKPKTTSKIYSEFHNKSTLSELFASLVETKKSKKELTQAMIKNFESPHLLAQLQAYLPSSNKNSTSNTSNKNISTESLYPSLDDDTEIMELMSCVKVNPSFKKEANEQYMRQSVKNEEPDSKEIEHVFASVKKSMFDISTVKKNHKSKLNFKPNEKQEEKDEFLLYFESYTASFKLFKKAIKALLTHYKRGFSGIISAYLLTLIGILRRLQLVSDLKAKKDIFDLSLKYVVNTQKYIDALKRDLVSEAKMLVNLRDCIERAKMPYKTFEILTPYLEEQIELIDRVECENFTFFFFSITVQKFQEKNMCLLYMIEVMYILLHREYEIVYFEADFPKHYDEEYVQLRKTIMENMVPKLHW